jgi:O-antigen ligase
VTVPPVATTPTAVAPFRAAEHLEAQPPAGRAQTLAARLAQQVPSTLVAATCAWWLIVATRWWGGRGPGAVTGGAILTALAVIAIRPDRHLPARVLGLATAISAGAFLVALTAPTGWSGATTAASYVCAAWVAVVVAAAVVRDRRMVDVIAVLMVVGAIYEVSESWLAWWGSQNPAHPISGTFYWYDPFAAFLITGSGIGLTLWLRRTGPISILGLATFVLGCIGMVYSTSRAATACLFGVIVLICLTHLVTRRIAGLVRLAIAAVVTVVAVWGVAGPPFFPNRVAPFAGTAARSSGQSLGQNGGYRLEFWHEALGVFGRYPITGGGFHSLATLSAGHVPASWVLSPLAHNGYLQVLSDGGLILGVPFLLAVAGLCWLVARSLIRSVRQQAFGLTSFVVPLCLAAMLVHSAVDFDWSYAADFSLVAILAGLVIGSWVTIAPVDDSPRDIRSSRLIAATTLVAVALLGVAAVTSWSGDLRQSLPVGHSANHGGVQ